MGRRSGLVVRALALHQCGLGSIPVSMLCVDQLGSFSILPRKPFPGCSRSSLVSKPANAKRKARTSMTKGIKSTLWLTRAVRYFKFFLLSTQRSIKLISNLAKTSLQILSRNFTARHFSHFVPTLGWKALWDFKTVPRSRSPCPM